MTAPSLATPSPLVSLFHDPAGTAFADLTIESHRETWPIRQTISKLVAARRACRPHAASGPDRWIASGGGLWCQVTPDLDFFGLLH